MKRIHRLLLGGSVLGGLAYFLTRKSESSTPSSPSPPAPPLPTPVGPYVPPSPSPAPFPPPPADTISARVDTLETPLNIRSGPGETYPVIGTAARGEIVHVIDAYPKPATAAAPDGWVLIQNAGGIRGFASASYLTWV